LAYITGHLEEIPYIYQRRELFSDRHGRGRERAAPGYAWAQKAYAAMLRRYHWSGSLGENLQPSCPDERTNDGDPAEALLSIVGLPDLWPLEAALEEH
jgi:hypothetical protein